MRNQPLVTRNGLEKKPSSVPKSEFTRCNSIPKHVIMIFYDCFSVFCLVLVHFSILSSHGKSFWSFVYVIIYCVGAGICTLISISDWSDPYFFRPKIEKTRSVKEGKEGKVFSSRQSRHISFVIIMIKVICTFTWRVNNYVSRQGRGFK